MGKIFPKEGVSGQGLSEVRKCLEGLQGGRSRQRPTCRSRGPPLYAGPMAMSSSLRSHAGLTLPLCLLCDLGQVSLAVN
jgi:hypothetical protein